LKAPSGYREGCEEEVGQVGNEWEGDNDDGVGEGSVVYAVGLDIEKVEG